MDHQHNLKANYLRLLFLCCSILHCCGKKCKAFFLNVYSLLNKQVVVFTESTVCGITVGSWNLEGEKLWSETYLSTRSFSMSAGLRNKDTIVSRTEVTVLNFEDSNHAK